MQGEGWGGVNPFARGRRVLSQPSGAEPIELWPSHAVAVAQRSEVADGLLLALEPRFLAGGASAFGLRPSPSDCTKLDRRAA